MADPENPTNPIPEEPKAKEPAPTAPPAGPREGEKPAASKADAPPKVSGAKKSGKQKKRTAGSCGRGGFGKPFAFRRDRREAKNRQGERQKDRQSGHRACALDVHHQIR